MRAISDGIWSFRLRFLFCFVLIPWSVEFKYGAGEEDGEEGRGDTALGVMTERQDTLFGCLARSLGHHTSL